MIRVKLRLEPVAVKVPVEREHVAYPWTMARTVREVPPPPGAVKVTQDRRLPPQSSLVAIQVLLLRSIT
ncbi:MAG: hypothetical protein AMXMBFR64_27310 [Myxococcales bacterium]